MPYALPAQFNNANNVQTPNSGFVQQDRTGENRPDRLQGEAYRTDLAQNSGQQREGIPCSQRQVN